MSEENLYSTDIPNASYAADVAIKVEGTSSFNVEEIDPPWLRIIHDDRYYLAMTDAFLSEENVKKHHPSFHVVIERCHQQATFEKSIVDYVVLHHEDQDLPPSNDPTVDEDDIKHFAIYLPRVGNVVIMLIRHYLKSECFRDLVQRIVNQYETEASNEIRDSCLQNALWRQGEGTLINPGVFSICVNEFDYFLYYVLVCEVIWRMQSTRGRLLTVWTCEEMFRSTFQCSYAEGLLAISAYAKQFLSDHIPSL